MRFFCEWMLAMGAAAPTTAGRAAERRTIAALSADRRTRRRASRRPGAAGRRRRRPQHRDLLDRDRLLARRRARARNRRGELLRHERPGLGVHDRLPDPQPGRATCSPTRRCRRRSCRSSPTAPAGPPARGVPAGLDAVLDHADRARRDHRRSSSSPPGMIMPLFTGPTFTAPLDSLTVGLSQVLFPVVLLLGLTGLLVGILQSYDHFTIPAIAPAVWNLVIIVLLVVLRPHFHGGTKTATSSTRTRSRSWSATFVQLLMAVGALGRIDFRLQFSIDWHDPRVRQVFTLMLPGDDRPRDRQPRPADQLGVRHARLRARRRARSTTRSASTCSRRACSASRSRRSCSRRSAAWPPAATSRGDAARGGDRHAPDQPAADPVGGVHHRARDADRAARVPARPLHAHSTHLVSIALFWFAFSLPFGGINLLLTRMFFAVQRPWIPTASRRSTSSST